MADREEPAKSVRPPVCLLLSLLLLGAQQEFIHQMFAPSHLPVNCLLSL